MTKTVNHWGVWVDTDTPITGVIANNTIFWLEEELINGINLDLENHAKECKECQENEFEYCEEAELFFESRGDILIGDWIIDKNGLYDFNPKGEYAAICREIYTQVIYSKHTTKCALCSPCYPGQGDIGSIGEFLAYTLPSELMGTELELQGLE